jgi:hypothetical protein
MEIVDSIAFPLRGVRYIVGVSAISTGVEEPAVNVTFSGATCPVGQVFQNGGCSAPTPLTVGTHTQTLKKGEVTYYSYAAPELLGSFTFSQPDEKVLSFLSRFQGTPTAEENDGTNAVAMPRPGDWYFAVIALEDSTNYNFTFAVDECASKDKAGPGCTTPYFGENDLYHMNLTYNTPYYFKVRVNGTHPLRVSARTVSGKDFPTLYASRGQLPTDTQYQLKNCNFDWCDGAFILHVNINVTDPEDDYFEAANQTWFIRSYTDVINNTYGVWFDTVCPSECTDQNVGECQMEYPGYGKCVCATSALVGVDCTIRDGLGPEYIVLIIIGGLVIASAIIGFVAWAYMRRKRVQYEHVS